MKDSLYPTQGCFSPVADKLEVVGGAFIGITAILVVCQVSCSALTLYRKICGNQTHKHYRDYTVHFHLCTLTCFVFTKKVCTNTGFVFVLFNDTWSQWGRSVSCILNFQITISDITPHIKWAVSLVIALITLIFLRGLCEYVSVNILTLSPLEGIQKQDFKCNIAHSARCTHKTALLIVFSNLIE